MLPGLYRVEDKIDDYKEFIDAMRNWSEDKTIVCKEVSKEFRELYYDFIDNIDGNIKDSKNFITEKFKDPWMPDDELESSIEGTRNYIILNSLGDSYEKHKTDPFEKNVIIAVAYYYEQKYHFTKV